MTTTLMSSIKEGCYKPRLHVSVNLLAGVWPPSCATLRHHCCGAYPPMINTASHEKAEKIISGVCFAFPYGYGAPLRQSFAITICGKGEK